MRTEGTLTKWNEAEARGFLVPTGGGDEVAVHVSSLPRDGLRPRNGEMFSWETVTDADGTPRASAVWRLGDRASAAAAVKRRHDAARRSKSMVLWAVVVAVAAAAYVMLGR